MKYGALAVVAVLLLACVALAGDHPLLVASAWLAERLGRADVRIVDLSDAEDYAKRGAAAAAEFGAGRRPGDPLRRPSKRRLTHTRDS